MKPENHAERIIERIAKIEGECLVFIDNTNVPRVIAGPRFVGVYTKTVSLHQLKDDIVTAQLGGSK